MGFIFWELCPLAIYLYEIVVAPIPESLILIKFLSMVCVLNNVKLLTDAIADTCQSAREESNNAHTSKIGNFVYRAPILRCSVITIRWQLGLGAEALRVFCAGFYGTYPDISRS